jgi:hypothetical protein
MTTQNLLPLRALVRREMAKLIEEGKVVAVESEKKNIGKLYKPTT